MCRNWRSFEPMHLENSLFRGWEFKIKYLLSIILYLHCECWFYEGVLDGLLPIFEWMCCADFTLPSNPNRGIRYCDVWVQKARTIGKFNNFFPGFHWAFHLSIWKMGIENFRNISVIEYLRLKCLLLARRA